MIENENLDFLCIRFKIGHWAFKDQRNQSIHIFVLAQPIVADTPETIEQFVVGEFARLHSGSKIAESSAHCGQQLIQTGNNLIAVITPKFRSRNGGSKNSGIL
jgi:hypothetical protein